MRVYQIQILHLLRFNPKAVTRADDFSIPIVSLRLDGNEKSASCEIILKYIYVETYEEIKT
jgi:hypothetical protein